MFSEFSMWRMSVKTFAQMTDKGLSMLRAHSVKMFADAPSSESHIQTAEQYAA